MLSTNNIIVEKHARVFISKPVDQGDEVWILFHGYGQNVKEFFESFTKKEFEKKCFILPEGLSKFYQKGLSGIVGASWMTKEDRQLEMVDQKKYLNRVIKEYNLSDRKINIFAFSQGAATAARWISKNNLAINKLFIWSGSIPEEILNNKHDLFWSYRPQFFVGKNDQFINQKTWEKMTKSIDSLSINYYDGDHFFTPELIKMYVLRN